MLFQVGFKLRKTVYICQNVRSGANTMSKDSRFFKRTLRKSIMGAMGDRWSLVIR